MKNPDWKMTDLLLRVVSWQKQQVNSRSNKESLSMRITTTKWPDQRKKELKQTLLFEWKKKTIIATSETTRDSKIQKTLKW